MRISSKTPIYRRGATQRYFPRRLGDFPRPVAQAQIKMPDGSRAYGLCPEASPFDPNRGPLAVTRVIRPPTHQGPPAGAPLSVHGPRGSNSLLPGRQHRRADRPDWVARRAFTEKGGQRSGVQNPPPVSNHR